MLEKILHLERDAFFFLNGSNSVFLDNFMWLYTGKVVWIPLALFIIALIVYKKDWRESLLILFSIVLVVTFCDQFASHLCKPLFMRFRPTHHPDFMNDVDIVLNYRGGRFGFISSHAANSFGFAVYLSYLFKNKLLSFSIFLWAVLTSYSRIYLGVHFISDIICGMLAGMILGYIVYKIYLYSRMKLFSITYPVASTVIYSTQRINIIAYAILICIIIVFVFANQLMILS
jgi:undecaprenyl-diphosphatase